MKSSSWWSILRVAIQNFSSFTNQSAARGNEGKATKVNEFNRSEDYTNCCCTVVWFVSLLCSFLARPDQQRHYVTLWWISLWFCSAVLSRKHTTGHGLAPKKSSSEEGWLPRDFATTQTRTIFTILMGSIQVVTETGKKTWWKALAALPSWLELQTWTEGDL